MEEDDEDFDPETGDKPDNEAEKVRQPLASQGIPADRPKFVSSAFSEHQDPSCPSQANPDCAVTFCSW